MATIGFFYRLYLGGAEISSGGWDASDLGLTGSSTAEDAAVATVARLSGEATPWRPFRGDRCDTWGPVDISSGTLPGAEAEPDFQYAIPA